MTIDHKVLTAIAIGMLVTGRPVAAHHSAAAAYDLTRKVEIQGTITKVILRNPHSFTNIDVVDGNGQKVEWLIEMNGTSEMFARGWTPDLLAVGMMVKVVGSPSRAPGTHGITQAKFSTMDGTPIGPKD